MKRRGGLLISGGQIMNPLRVAVSVVEKKVILFDTGTNEHHGVIVRVDLSQLGKQLARRAAKNKSKRASMADGAVIVENLTHV